MTRIELPRSNECIFGLWFGYVKYINLDLDGTSLVINDLNGIMWCLWIELCLNHSLDYWYSYDDTNIVRMIGREEELIEQIPDKGKGKAS